jgi:lipopolysaccharide export system permease protein
MQLLTRYLLAQFVRYFLTINVGFVAVYLLIDFFEKYDEFAEAGKPASLIIQFFLYNIPFVIDQLGPILILLSGVITLGILNHSNELTALKAAGIPLRRITRPIFIAALLVTTLFIGVAQFLLPKTISQTNDIWFEQVRGKVPLGIFRNGRYYFKGSEGFYSFNWPNNKHMTLINFSYSTWDEDYNIETVTVARFARWTRFGWSLKKGHIQKSTGDGSFETELFGARYFFFPETTEDFLIPEYESAEMSLTGLFQDIDDQETESDTTTARSEFYSRISYLILGIPLLLLGLPILILSYKKWGRDLSIAIPVSCGMAFFAWGVWGALQSLAKTGYVPAVPAALAVHIVFSLIGVYLLRKQDR